MNNPFEIRDTVELLGVIKNITPEANYLTKTFFPKKNPPSISNFVAVEYMSQGRMLAPFVVRNSLGANVNRSKSRVKFYSAPMMAPRRVIGLEDIERRMFGETPVFSSMTPAERAARMQADDFTELLRAIENSKNKVCADILQTGKAVIRGLADDGVVEVIDEIDFEMNHVVRPQVDWNNPAATIFDDLRACSERIQQDSGIIPTLMVCGANIEKYLLNNTEIFKWLSVPSRENLNMMTFQPHYTSPQARLIGYIGALNLEVVSYLETYTDDITGTVKPFIDANTAIIGNPGRGKQLFGSVNLLDESGWHTYSAEVVPFYRMDPNAQQSSLTLFSRWLAAPEVTDDFICIKAVA